MIFAEPSQIHAILSGVWEYMAFGAGLVQKLICPFILQNVFIQG